jgi:hypothetical protein
VGSKVLEKPMWLPTAVIIASVRVWPAVKLVPAEVTMESSEPPKLAFPAMIVLVPAESHELGHDGRHGRRGDPPGRTRRRHEQDGPFGPGDAGDPVEDARPQAGHGRRLVDVIDQIRIGQRALPGRKPI